MAENDGVVVETVDTVQAAPAVEVVPPLIDKTPAVEPEKTFTQAQLEKQLGQRLARERAKFDRDLQTEREQRIRLEERLNSASPKEAPKGDDAEPDLKDFTDFGKYTAAMSRYTAKQVLQGALTERETAAKTERANAAQAATAAEWQKKVSASLKDMPDFNEVLAEASEVPMPPHMQQAIMESDEGPRLAYYLAQHPEDAYRIAAMTPNGAVRALTLIEVGFQKKPVTATPAPITPIGSRQTSGPKALTSPMSQSEFERRRRAFIAKR